MEFAGVVRSHYFFFLISASGVSPTWVKSNERRRRREREIAKVSVNNGQYIHRNQNLNNLLCDGETCFNDITKKPRRTDIN